MGSKNLKAIAVQGTGTIPLAQPEQYAVLRREANLALRQDAVTRALRQLGSASGGDYFDYLGEMPKRYFSRGTFARTSSVSGSQMAETILSGVSTCHGCVIACGRKVTLEDGQERKGPEYETLAGFGPNLEIDDLEAIVGYGELCDRYGMDTISLSNIIGLAFTLIEADRLPKPEGLARKDCWGNVELVERLIHDTARREGLGALLALGARGLAEHAGAPDQAVQVNGLEIAYHDPRGASGMALVYATSPRGACHNQSDYFMVDIGQTFEELGIDFHERQGGAEKAASVVRHQNWRTVSNALVMCLFANVPPDTVVSLVNKATGCNFGLESLSRVGERAWNLKRLINHRLGLTGEDDRLPPPLLQPMPDGGSQGFVPPFKEMLAAYYDARGWDPASGRPTEAKLRQLGLDETILGRIE